MKFSKNISMILLVAFAIVFNACGGTHNSERDPYIVSVVEKINEFFAKQKSAALEEPLIPDALTFEGNRLVYSVLAKSDKLTEEQKKASQNVLQLMVDIPSLAYSAWMTTEDRDKEDVVTPEFFTKMYQKGMDVLIVIKDEKGKVYAKKLLGKESLKMMADYSQQRKEMKENEKIFRAAIEVEMFTDSRDKNVYRIGNIIDVSWMLDDLAYGGEDRYTWTEANNSCPEGWRLPTYEELVNGRFQKLWPNYIKTKNEPVFWSSTKKKISGKEVVLAVQYKQGVEKGWGYLDSATIRVPVKKVDSPTEKKFVRCIRDYVKKEVSVKLDSMQDSRDGLFYKTVQVGSQVWMAENLNFKTEHSRCIEDSTGKCPKGGMLYRYDDAVSACPSGWHLPLLSEYDELKGIVHKSAKNVSIDDLMGSGFFWFFDIRFGPMAVGENGNDMRNVSIKDTSMHSVRCVKGNQVKKEALSSVIKGSMLDSRDGHVYQIVQIGSQTWFAENMALGMKDKDCIDGYGDLGYCLNRGQAYTYKEAQDVCPTGWRLPTKSDFDTLFLSMFGYYKESYDDNFLEKMDQYGFFVFQGARDRVALDGEERWWTSSLKLRDELERETLGFRTYRREKRVWCSLWSYARSDSTRTNRVRCIKDTNAVSEIPAEAENIEGTSSSEVKIDTLVDERDGKKYKTVQIGPLTWMAENLNYRTKWDSYCYEKDSANCEKYGRLYTWDAAMKACPDGWHLPTKAEFEALIDFAGGEKVAGMNLKSKDGWKQSGNEADIFGFSALPAGFTNRDGYSHLMNDYAFYWSATENGGYDAYGMYLGHNFVGVHLDDFTKYYGFSIRCVKD